MLNYLLVFIGGGLGSICRYGISDFLSRYDHSFPFATLVANIISCLILGFLLGLSMKSESSHVHKFLLMTGFCGGFSTFSTFTNETFQLFQANQHLHALTNICLSIFVCLICIGIGVKLSQ